MNQYIVDGVAQRMIALDADIVLYCHSDNRSGRAKKALIAHGYKMAFNAGGYEQLRDRLQSERYRCNVSRELLWC